MSDLQRPSAGAPDASSAGGITELKRALRNKLRAVVASVSPEESARRSSLVCERVLAWPTWNNARAVMLYSPIPGEVDVTALGERGLAAGKRVCLPRVDWENRELTPVEVKDMSRGLVETRYGVREPGGEGAGVEGGGGAPGPVGVKGAAGEGAAVRIEEIDLVIVPGLGFDRTGARIGRGAGFYDRFLGRPGLRATTIGVGFVPQIVHTIPTEANDVRVHAVATDDELIEIGRGG